MNKTIAIVLILFALLSANCTSKPVIAGSAVPRQVCFSLTEAQEIRRAQIRREALIRRLQAENQRLREALRKAKKPAPLWPVVVLFTVLIGGATAVSVVSAARK